jgi:endo-1,3(4)-beta-glucanase
VNDGLAQATSNFNGVIQIAKSPDEAVEALYDAACGAYPTTATLPGVVNSATYADMVTILLPLIFKRGPH